MRTFQLLILSCSILLLHSCGNAGGNGDNSKNNEKGKESEKSSGIELGDERQGGIKLPADFKGTVVAKELGSARDIVAKENGDIYVLLSGKENGKCLVALRDRNGDGKADTSAYFGEHCGRGSLVIRDEYLYHSTERKVLRTRFESMDELVPSGSTETIVEGFKNDGEHGNKNFDIDGKGNLYVTVGAPANACQKEHRTPGSEGKDPCPLLEEHAGVWKLDADRKGQDQLEDGERFSTGIRNMVAVDWNENAGKLYGVQHGRDQLHQFFPDLYSKEESAKLPAEEMFLIEEGTDFGWPYCYYDGLKDKKVLAPEYGGDGDKVGRCKEKDDPIAHFPAHFAPNNLHFYGGDQFPDRFRNGAFVAFHGSWNRPDHKQWGYNVTFLPFDGEMPAGDWDTFAAEFEGAERVDSPGEAEYRPCGLTEGPDGSLYIVDSKKGRVWKVEHKG